MLASHGSTTLCAAQVQVTVTDLPGVQRLLTLLTGRAHALTRFQAEECGARRWQVTIHTLAGLDELTLLEARLHRLPNVLTVRLSSNDLAAAG